jgi:hypothetical protein
MELSTFVILLSSPSISLLGPGANEVFNMKRFVQLGCLAVAAFSAAVADTVSLQPVSTISIVGSPLTLDVNVAGLTDLYAFQFDVIFDPAVLSAISITEGSLFSSVGVFFSPGIIDNTAGTITFIGDSLSGPGPGISLDGTLAQILFNAIGPGSSSIDLANIVLLDSGLNDIAATASGAAVTVNSTPEPATAAMLAGVLAAIAIIGLRKRKMCDSASDAAAGKSCA